jgi:hypothetical protein
MSDEKLPVQSQWPSVVMFLGALTILAAFILILVKG